MKYLEKLKHLGEIEQLFVEGNDKGFVKEKLAQNGLKIYEIRDLVPTALRELYKSNNEEVISYLEMDQSELPSSLQGLDKQVLTDLLNKGEEERINREKLKVKNLLSKGVNVKEIHKSVDSTILDEEEVTKTMKRYVNQEADLGAGDLDSNIKKLQTSSYVFYALSFYKFVIMGIGMSKGGLSIIQLILMAVFLGVAIYQSLKVEDLKKKRDAIDK